MGKPIPSNAAFTHEAFSSNPSPRSRSAPCREPGRRRRRCRTGRTPSRFRVRSRASFEELIGQVNRLVVEYLLHADDAGVGLGVRRCRRERHRADRVEDILNFLGHTSHGISSLGKVTPEHAPRCSLGSIVVPFARLLDSLIYTISMGLRKRVTSADALRTKSGKAACDEHRNHERHL